MDNYKDLTGQVFTRLTVLCLAGKTKNREYRWLCRCECGNERIVAGTILRRGQSKSCGCLKREMLSERNRKDLTGQVFGRLTAKECLGYQGGKSTSYHWLCDCACGKTVSVLATSLLTGNSKSCGCLRHDSQRLRSSLINGSFDPNTSLDKVGRQRDLAEEQFWKLETKRLKRFTCEICGQEGGLLHSHHLFSYVHYPLLRYEFWNCAVICSKDHKEFHRLYGIGANTATQWAEFYKIKTGLDYVNPQALDF